MIRGYLFDLDGTILDSMRIWEDLGERILRDHNCIPEEGLSDVLYPMSLEEAGEYLVGVYDLACSAEQLQKEAIAKIADYYRKETQLKPDAKEVLQRLKRRGFRIAAATAGNKELSQAALERCGVLECFDFILTCDEAGKSKKHPDIYLQAAERMGLKPKEIVVVEDSLAPLCTAGKAGFPTAAVYDSTGREDSALLRQTGDLWLGTDTLKGLLKGEKTMKTALTIAGSDSSGGAGIQADLKTMTVNGVFAMSAITALTAQNTTGVTGIMEVTPEFLAQQIDAVFTDIRPDAVKIGMVSSGSLITTIAEKLQEYGAENIVVDPVMVATSGAKLISDDAIATLKEKLLPLATVLTPNIPEAEVLADMKVTTEEDMITAAKKIGDTYHCAVLCKGGHSLNDANDLLYHDGSYEWFNGRRIDNPNTHGTGCTLSSAIASNLAKGYDLSASVNRAKEYISGALADMLDLGKGSGPMNHGFDVNSRFAE